MAVYDATKEVLLAQGVAESEIAFIHDAKTDVQREQLFEKIRKGEIRILMGSTEKMGTGMNVQEKLIALHHLDIPWRPADLTQRNGRILRQGNDNAEVSIFTHITENTFDAYLYQILEQKQRYISQIMTGRSEDPYLTSFLKYRNIQSLKRGLLVELVKFIYIHEDGSIEIEFNYADQFRRIVEFVENNNELYATGGNAVS